MEKIYPVEGAAIYEAIGKEVWMTDTDGYQTMIESKPSYDSALKAAYRWQKKENKAASKNNKLKR